MTKTAADANYREQSTNLRNGEENEILDHVDKLVSPPSKIEQMTAAELDELVEALLAEEALA